MKQLHYLFALILVSAVCLPMQGQTLLSQFGSINYEGWVYDNNAGTAITTQNINNRRIVLLTTVQNNVTALISPTIDCTGYDSLRIEMMCQMLQPTYDATLLAVTAQLTDIRGDEKALGVMNFGYGDTEQTITTTLALPESDDANYRLRFTAPNANKDNCAAVMRVRVYGITGVTGDVNGDGLVDVDDINILINIILHKDDAENYGQRAYVTGGEFVDIADINKVINIVLHKE